MHEKSNVIEYGIQSTKRGFFINLVFSFVFFSLYYVFSLHFLSLLVGPTSENLPLLQASFNFVLAITLLLASFVIKKFKKMHVISAASVATIATLILVFLIPNTIFRLGSVFALGVFLSLGQLAFFTYFWTSTVSVERGRVAGLIGFITLPVYFVAVPLFAENLSFTLTILLTGILSSSLLLLILLKPEKQLIIRKSENGSTPEKRTVLFYSIPWILFSLINATLAKNISLSIYQAVPSSFYLVLLVIQMIASGFGALGGGIVADLLGRRLPLAFSLILYGLSSALAGIFTNVEVLGFIYAANGLSWGILFILYSFVVWGDMSNNENCAKVYSIGLSVFYLTIGLGFLPTDISQISVIASSLFSCVLIFLSNIPIVLAPELLSSNFLEKIRLKLHITAVKKLQKRN